MVRDAQEHAEEDRQRREEVETRNQAEALTFQAERTLKDLGDKVSSEDKAEVENKVASLREALKGSDIEAVKAGMTSLAEVAPAGVDGRLPGRRVVGRRAGERVLRRGRRPARAARAPAPARAAPAERGDGRGRVQGGLGLRVPPGRGPGPPAIAGRPARSGPARGTRFLSNAPPGEHCVRNFVSMRRTASICRKPGTSARRGHARRCADSGSRAGTR